MKQMLIGAAVALVVSSAIGSSRAATGDEDVIQQAKDRAQIEALMWRYTRALDTADAETRDPGLHGRTASSRRRQCHQRP